MDACTGAIMLEGVDVEDEWLAGVFLHFYPGEEGHPVMSVDDVEGLTEGELRGEF
jgi:hypothetical protein